MPEKSLFQTQTVPATPGSERLFDERLVPPEEAAPVVCLGKTFASDTERRAYFTEELRKHLADPAFRATEGFPHGKDEDILALSDPPYYTACPNPWLADFVAEWEKENTRRTGKTRLAPTYHREPFAADVSEGKNDPIYNAHSYHTKVPHKAIMRYILHYIEPGDIVFDGFCGTGMTGVAAQMCGNRAEVESLGYRVDDAGVVYSDGVPFSRLGARRAVLADLSPAATFIAYNYNTPVDAAAFEKEARRILAEVEAECGWMYETAHSGDGTGKINYTVWSEVFSCPYCEHEIVYFDAAVEKETFAVNDIFSCPHCGAKVDKKSLQRQWNTAFDAPLNTTHPLVRYKPVLINYQVGGGRFSKKPDEADLRLLEKIENMKIDDSFPVMEMPEGERKEKDGYHLKGITHLHHFYFKRALAVYARMWAKLSTCSDSFTRFFVQQFNPGFTKMNRYQPVQFGRVGGSQVNRYFSGTLFVGSLISEVSPMYAMNHKLDRLLKLSLPGRYGNYAISCQSSTALAALPDNSVDYIFIDPPFGNNLNYSELNFFWEAWLGILTQRAPEAVMDKGRNRTLRDYQDLMTDAFREIHRVLKLGRWITIEFHNSSNKVWAAIQDALERSGFVIADVRTLDKQQDTYKQSIQKLVKQDLVISAYKPNGGLEERFKLESDTEAGVWDFVNSHLKHLPVFSTNKDGDMEIVSERMNYLLYDRMLSFYVRRNVYVPLDASEFYSGLKRKYAFRDDMYFLTEQAAEYDKKRLTYQGKIQLNLFVSDEVSAIQWLRQQLNEKPQTTAELNPQFMKQLGGFSKNEKMLELNELLEQNFIEDGSGRWRCPDPEHAADIEKLREKALLREFEAYKQGKNRLKVFRLEAVRVGFRKAYASGDYKTIVTISERLPSAVLDEDPKLLLWYSNAKTRLGEE